MTDTYTRRPHALVVGASSGIGYAVAERLISTHEVTALARRTELLSPLVERGAVAMGCDVADLESIGPILDEAVQARGKIAGLIYCAGVQQIKPIRLAANEDIRRAIDVNLTAALVFARHFAGQRVSDAGSAFCAISSVAAQRPEPAIVPYAVAKAGLEAMIKGLARELAPRRIIGVAPGWLDTPMTRAFKKVYNDRFKEELAKTSPRGIATVDAVVDLIEFLLSPRAAYITGQIVTIEGGASL